MKNQSALQVHTTIATDAKKIANQNIQGYPEILAMALMGDVFEVGTDQEHSITLKWNSGLDESPQNIIDILHQVGRAAIKEALLDNKELFVGLIVGHARNGDNYFDLFRP